MDEKGRKKCTHRNENLKANRTSETEEQRKERLRINTKKIEQEGEPKIQKAKKSRPKQKPQETDRALVTW